MSALVGLALLWLGLAIPPVTLFLMARSRSLSLWAKTVLSALVIVLAANVTLWPYVLTKDAFPVFYYESSDHGFRGREFTKINGSMDRVMIDFDAYKERTGDKTLQLCRTFSVRPWVFWRWGEYLTEPRYGMPFIRARYCPHSREGENDPRCADYPRNGPEVSE